MDGNAAAGRTQVALLLAVCAAIVTAQALAFHHVVDDAFISYRYAEQWLAGHGVVFNPGERVEGYTNFLWVVTSAGFLGAGVSPLGGARVLGLLGAFACLVACYSMARRLEPRAAWLAPIALALHSSLGFWAWGGLETTFFAGLVALALALHLDGRLSHAGEGALWLAACLTRPEGALLFAVVLAGALIGRGGPLLARVRTIVVPAGIVIAGVAAHLVWRRIYYGAWLPNTFHAKTGATSAQVSRGARHLMDFVLVSGGFLVLLPLMAWRADWRWRTLGAVVLVQAAYVVLVGGDNMLLHRFLVPMLAPLMALVAVTLSPLLITRRRAAVAVATLALLLCRVPDARLRAEVQAWNDSARDWIRVGRWLGTREPKGTVLALGAVGAIPYFSGLPTIDLFGLTDAHIARREVGTLGQGFPGHEKGDGAYVLSRAPDIILGRVRIFPMPPDRDAVLFAMGETLGERELRDDPRFLREYRYETPRIGAGYIALFRRVSAAAVPSTTRGDGR